VPGVYADVSEGLCFIEYATKCALGDVNLYDIKDCDGWIINKYCETMKELQKLNDEVLIFLDYGLFCLVSGLLLVGLKVTIIKFVFFEKATKFDEISFLLLTNKCVFFVSH
jgi:hypothetical protein